MLVDACPWWLRGWHRRWRAHDLNVMWLALYRRADTIETARVAWEAFVAQPGQWHWRCPCGRPFRLLFEPMLIAVDTGESEP